MAGVYKLIHSVKSLVKRDAMDGIKITFSPFSQFSKISEALELIFGLPVNHHRRACVSAIKFMILKLNVAVKRLFGGGNILVSDIDPFDNALQGDYFLVWWRKLLEDGQL